MERVPGISCWYVVLLAGRELKLQEMVIKFDRVCDRRQLNVNTEERKVTVLKTRNVVIQNFGKCIVAGSQISSVAEWK